MIHVNLCLGHITVTTSLGVCVSYPYSTSRKAILSMLKIKHELEL